MNTKEKRERIYKTWMSLKDFQFNLDAIKENINRHQIHCFLFFGKYDEVIPVQVGRLFEQGLSNCTFTEVRRGHYFVDEGLNKYIGEAMEEQNKHSDPKVSPQK